MRKYYILGLIALVCIIIGFAWAEQTSLTTYYPAPYGVYRQIRLYPTDDFTPGGACVGNKGALYFDNSENEIQVCDGATWQRLGGGGGGGITVSVTTSILSGGWTELDLSAYVGVRPALVLLKVTSYQAFGLIAKPLSDPDEYDVTLIMLNVGMNAAAFTSLGAYQSLLVHTDNQGKLGLKSSETPANWEIEVIAYF